MLRAARLVRLDEAEARDPDLVGAKAGRLARARARGLPVLDGFVVPACVSDPIIRTGEAALGSRTRSNSGAARSAVYNHPPPPLLHDLAEVGRRLGGSLVVRSSSRAEAEGLWAGAFSSYVGVAPEELTHATIGCWASVFNPDALTRGEMVGTPLRDVGMAVLVQPEIRPVSGGVATRRDGGTVSVCAASGHPAGLVAGRERGYLADVTPGGDVQADPSPLGSRLLRKVADLCRASWESMGCGHIEWMEGPEGQLHLVQAQPDTDMRGRDHRRPVPEPTRDAAPWMRHAARMMVRYPGPVGERYVWPWAIGMEGLSSAPAERTGRSRLTLVEEVRRGAARLMAQRWGGPDATADVERAWSMLRNGDSAPLADLISRHPSVGRRLAVALLRDLQELGQVLTTASVIPHPGWVWHLDPDSFGPAAGGGGPIRRIPPTFWDIWIHGVVTSQGVSVAGTPAAGGWGAGRLRYIHNAEDTARFSPREVIATPLPVVDIAPLLWNASGLVTMGGNPGAHLFEVAGWLGVPAVCGVDISRWTGEPGRPDRGADTIVAVDGDRGRISLLP